jgi:hypothetical protein
MKTSLKALAREIKPAPPPKPEPPPERGYATAQTRTDTRQISGHYPTEDVHAFRILAAEMDMDVQELLAEALNMVFERHGRPNRIPITSGRRKKRGS